jgi:ornithine--oxo-acid transaminase
MLRRTFSTKTNKHFIDLDKRVVCSNYASVPVAIERGQGIYVWDAEGNKYIDFVAGISACNQGHCHPKITKALIEQAQKLTQTSRAFHNTKMGEFSEYLTGLLGFDKFLPSSSGVEACESACKLARRWGYVVKGVENDKASIIMAKGCFWGRSITASGGSSDPKRYTNFGPFTPGFPLVNFNDVNAIEEELKRDKNCVAVMLEPI